MKRMRITPLGQRNVRKMIIRIAKEKFWIDTDFTECWPEILLKLPPEIPTKTKYEVMHTYLEEDVDEQGRFYQHEVLGLFGAERKNEQEILLHGCNFIKYAKNGFLLSEDARQLCDAYMADNQWEQRLLEQALKYSLRVRAIIAALMDGGTLVSEYGFLNNRPQMALKHEKTVYYPFKYKTASTYPNLNTLLMEFKQIALGPFWRAELGITEHQDFALYSGSTGANPPSIDQIGLNMKPFFILMHQLGWFTEKKGGMLVLNKRKIKKEIDAAVYKSLMNGKKTTATPVKLVETVEANATKAAKKTTKAKATKAATSTRKITKAKATEAVKSTTSAALPAEEVKPASAAKTKTTKTAKSAAKTKKAATSAKKTTKPKATTPAKAAKATKPTRSTKSAKPAAKTKATKPATPTTPPTPPAKEVRPTPAAKPKATKTAKTKKTTTSAKETTKAKATKVAKTAKAKATKAAVSAKKTTKAKTTKAAKPTVARAAKITKTAKSELPPSAEEVKPASAPKTKTTKTTKPVARTKKAAASAKTTTKPKAATPAKAAKTAKPTRSTKPAKPAVRATKASRTAKSVTKGKRAA